MGESDFSWSEVGARIKDKRIQLGMSQQALAAAAHLTQNGVFRLETGATNPQLSSLRYIAAALSCTVRELLTGVAGENPALDDRVRRVTRIVEAGDEAALKVLDNGIETAEVLLERSGGRRGLPPLNRIAKGEGRRSPADELLLMKGPKRSRSEVDDEAIAALLQKADIPFRNIGTKYETKRKPEKQ